MKSIWYSSLASFYLITSVVNEVYVFISNYYSSASVLVVKVAKDIFLFIICQRYIIYCKDCIIILSPSEIFLHIIAAMGLNSKVIQMTNELISNISTEVDATVFAKPVLYGKLLDIIGIQLFLLIFII